MCGWGTAAPAATDIDAVIASLLDFHSVEMRDNVRVVVGRCGNFIQQLGSNGAHAYESACARVLGHGEVAVGFYFGDWVTHISKAGHFLKKRIVAATALSAAFNNMTCGECAS